MIMALLIGRGGSVGFPNKNVFPILGRPLMSYPLSAALHSEHIDEVFVSTDCDKIKNEAQKYNVTIIDRPKELATSEALVEQVFNHGYNYVKNELNKKVELVVILMCNAPMILPSTIDEGINTLRTNKDIDSAVTVSGYNMFTPIRARRVQDGLLQPFIPLDKFNFKIDSNRQKTDMVYFHDCGVSVVRPECIENYKEGLLPQKWMGHKIFPLIQQGGLDIDYKYEIPIAEGWLKENGFTEKKIPYKA